MCSVEPLAMRLRTTSSTTRELTNLDALHGHLAEGVTGQGGVLGQGQPEGGVQRAQRNRLDGAVEADAHAGAGEGEVVLVEALGGRFEGPDGRRGRIAVSAGRRQREDARHDAAGQDAVHRKSVPDGAGRGGSRGSRCGCRLGDDGGMTTDTSEPAPSRGMPWVERKRKPDGSERRYRCELEHVSPSLVVVSYVMRQGGAVFGTPIEIPPGSVSYGYFWRARPYTVYRMRAGDRIVAHRFDAVAGVRLRAGEVAYRDLALDWWLTPEGELIEEDREEFEELREAGAFSAGEVAAVARAERVIARAGERLLPELAGLERRHGIA